MANSKTTIAGAVAGLCMIGGAFFPAIVPFCEPIGGLAMLALGYYAADSRKIAAWADDKSETDKDGNPISDEKEHDGYSSIGAGQGEAVR